MKTTFAFGLGSVIVSTTLVSGFASEFTLVPDQSVISLSGTAISFNLQEQGAGSLSTKYRGTIQADVANGIQFTGGSAITGDNNGSWQPLANGESGSAPAVYGGKADAGLLGQALAAVRNLQLDVISGSLPVNGESFDSSSLTFSFRTNANGTLDYRVSGFLPQKGSVPLAGYATNRVTTTATLATSGDTQTLTIPVKAEFLFKLISANDTKLTVTGQLVATRTVGGGGTSTFAEWASSQFPGQSDPSVVGPSADPDKDGLPNFVEYALGLDPNASNQDAQPVAARLNPQNPGEMVLDYSRPKGFSGASVLYSFRAGSPLGSWAPLTPTEEITDLGNGKEKVTVRQTISPGTENARFFVLTIAPK